MMEKPHHSFVRRQACSPSTLVQKTVALQRVSPSAVYSMGDIQLMSVGPLQCAT